jgi:hypothetical protein
MPHKPTLVFLDDNVLCMILILGVKDLEVNVHQFYGFAIFSWIIPIANKKELKNLVL